MLNYNDMQTNKPRNNRVNNPVVKQNQSPYPQPQPSGLIYKTTMLGVQHTGPNDKTKSPSPYWNCLEMNFVQFRQFEKHRCNKCSKMLNNEENGRSSHS